MSKVSLLQVFGVIGLVLMVLGFFLGHAADLPGAKRVVAPRSVGAQAALATLIQRSSTQRRPSIGFDDKTEGLPSISKADDGFESLAALYRESLRDAPGDVVRFSDPFAIVGIYGSTEHLVRVAWSNGKHSDTSREHLSKLIERDFARSAIPLQFWLFVIGFGIEAITLYVTSFAKTQHGGQ